VSPAKRQLDVVIDPVMASASMRQVERVLRTIAGKDVSVTLIGESGSGKEVIARRIHDFSHRRSGPFVPINCAAIPEALFESELFGHEKGAFTGASERALGKLEASSGGTLFLDEVAEMPMAAQAKLLRFLENRKFMRVGGTAKISVDTRLVCATLRQLEDEVKAGRFRADLFYRIQGITIEVPPLRERRADITPLVRQFVAQLSTKHATSPPRLSRAALAALRAHDWPGNVRELRNVVELVTLMRAGKEVRVRDLPKSVQRAAEPADTLDGASGSRHAVIEIPLDQPLEESVAQILRAVLAAEGGSRSGAARRLGISLRTVQRHLARDPIRSGR
jgi:DNA-binding NtrC family response regulator